jgi:dolichol-phosphate mannosyltransferase
MKLQYSIVAPVYNEEGNIQKLYERITQVMDSMGEGWELILVNDGSRDSSPELIAELTAKDSRIKAINFARNFGHQTAVTAGIDFSSGNAVILIDADLQDPPEVILDLIAKWKEGYEVVYAVSKSGRRSCSTESSIASLTCPYRLIQGIFVSWTRR